MHGLAGSGLTLKGQSTGPVLTPLIKHFMSLLLMLVCPQDTAAGSTLLSINGHPFLGLLLTAMGITLKATFRFGILTTTMILLSTITIRSTRLAVGWTFP
mmetsp:Transcript_1688/g.2665  ORF Transcript_1688/g.2665 Transcript_1688/m.2665 type:complete len:100 (+) Transcript_1688:371-670(+)